jgi:hypothetical protein
VVAGTAVAVPTPVEDAPPLQVYVLAPPAVRLAVAPVQMVGELTVVTGSGFTVTVATAVPVQEASVPVTV